MIGVELGLGQHLQNGTFQAECQCEFTSATGNGFLGGLLFELPVSYQWAFGLGVKLDLKGDTATTNILCGDFHSTFWILRQSRGIS